MKYILPKGFISVDGCSLTIGEVGGPRPPWGPDPEAWP